VGLFKEAPWRTYVEFTTTLLKDVMDTLVANQISQLKAYADLVREVSKSLEDFKKERVTDEAVDRYLVTNFPDPADQTKTIVVNGGKYTLEDYEKIKKLLKIEDPSKPLAEGGLDLPKPAGTPPTGTFDPTRVTNVRNKVKAMLESEAEDHYTELTTLVRMGMARIIVERGFIHTKLYIEIRAIETKYRDARDVTREAMGGGVQFGGILGLLGIGGSAGGNRTHIRTVTERDVTTVAAEAKMFGETRVEFRTETFPPP